MSVVRGSHLQPFLATKPSQHFRDLLGERLFELFYFQLFCLHTLHADPHWGNYLFRDDGSIGLIDFGCVKKMDAEVVRELRTSSLFPGDFDSPQFQQMIHTQFGRPGKPLPPKKHRAIIALSEQFYRKVYPPGEKQAKHPINFADTGILRNYLNAANKLAQARGTEPKYLFMARAEVGLYTTLHRLKARVHTTEILRRLLKQSESV
jgi:predicted unusual protein kinase regulating ubiquinone biosynthesis (AarF/ABC1/UbiB family)